MAEGMDLMKSLLMEGSDTPSSKDAFTQNDDPEKQKLAEEVHKDVAGAGPTVNTWRGAAKEDTKYYHGHQWPDLDRMRMENLRRPALVYNEIQVKIDAISGIQRMNRVDVRFQTRALDSDVIHDAMGDLATESVATVLDTSDGEFEDSRAAKDALISGMGWVEVATSYEDDIDGRIMVSRLLNTEMGWDPQAKKDNLDDSQFRYREKSFSREDFKKRWPGMIDKVDISAPYYEEMAVGKYELVTPYYSLQNEKVNPDITAQPITKARDIPVIQYQWRDQETVWRIADAKNPDQLQTVTEEEWSALEKKNELAGQPMPKAVRQQKAVFKQVFVALGLVLEDPVVLPRGFSLLCITGQYDDEKKVWYGLVRSLKDPQNTMNKAMSALVTQYITNVKGGVFYKTGTFADSAMAKTQYAQPDAWIEVNADVEIEKAIVPRQPSKISDAPPMLAQESKSAMSRISGIGDSVLGTDTGEATGPTMDRRAQGSLAILGWFWDNMTRFQKKQAETILEFVREYWSHGQLIRVGGDFNAKSIPLLKSQLPLVYDMVVDQSVRYNPNLKDQLWKDLISIAGPLMKRPEGAMILMKGLKYSSFPAQFVAEIQEAVQDAPPQPQKGKQEDPEYTQAKITKTNADAQKALAQARALDKESGLRTGELVVNAVMQGHELRHKTEQMKLKTLQDRIKLAKGMMGGTGAAPPIAGTPQQTA